MKKEQFLQHISNLHELAIVGPMPYSSAIGKDIPIIYVDGGLRHKKDHDHINISIGDQDSTSLDRKVDILLNQEKDESDLKCALDLIPAHIKTIGFHGFMGGRKDHFLANFGEIHHFLKGRKQTLCFLDESFISHSPGSFSIEHNGTFSVLTLEKQEIQITGDCQYKLESPTTISPLRSHTISNIAFGNVNFKGQAPVFIYLLDS